MSTIKAIIKELSHEQVEQIRYMETEYAVFVVSVFNIGSVVRLQFMDEYNNPSESEYWNGYDFIVYQIDANYLIDDALGKDFGYMEESED